MSSGAAAGVITAILGAGLQGQQAKRAGETTGEALTLSSEFQKDLFDRGL